MKLILVAITALLCVRASAAPLKVYILAGQSNMQGHAQISTFDYIGDDPATAPLLAEMRGADGQPRVLDKVWISSVGCLGDAYSDLNEKTGKLTAGYGAGEGKIGPEFTFGITIHKSLGEPVLLIKTAWGGRSLHTDFRPPGSGPYVWSDYELERLRERKDDIEKRKAEKIAETGTFYRHMIAHVKHVLADPKRVCPDYDAAQGVELAGFVWMQGFNDLVSDWTYDQSRKPGGYQLYADLLAQFIRDVRRDLTAPALPFVIGVMGIGGAEEGAKPQQKHFREAQIAPTLLPEFAGTVRAVETAPFWDRQLAAIDEKHAEVNQMRYFLDSKHKDHANKDGTMTDAQKHEYLEKFRADLISPAEAALWDRGASNAGYHYLGCAKTFARMGRAFAEALLSPAAIRYETRDVSGWQVHIQEKLLTTARGDTEKALGLLAQMLDEIVRLVPADAVARLRQVPLYFSPAYPKGGSGAEYHPGADWLRENGRDPAMVRGVEFSGIADFEAEMKRMPNFALHELAHAYHDRVLDGGFGNTELQAAYERAKSGGGYERVERVRGHDRPNSFERAYALTNAMEYFAESTEAYFIRNDFFPFTRAELRKHDPAMLALVEKLWGVPAEK